MSRVFELKIAIQSAVTYSVQYSTVHVLLSICLSVCHTELSWHEAAACFMFRSIPFPCMTLSAKSRRLPPKNYYYHYLSFIASVGYNHFRYNYFPPTSLLLHPHLDCAPFDGLAARVTLVSPALSCYESTDSPCRHMHLLRHSRSIYKSQSLISKSFKVLLRYWCCLSQNLIPWSSS